MLGEEEIWGKCGEKLNQRKNSPPHHFHHNTIMCSKFRYFELVEFTNLMKIVYAIPSALVPITSECNSAVQEHNRLERVIWSFCTFVVD